MKNFQVNSIFQSGMVLQRQKPIIVWGTAPTGALVTASLVKDKESHITKSQTGQDGTWQCTLPAQEAGEQYTLTLSCSTTSKKSGSNSAAIAKTIFLDNISIGDVWLACGQSNMEFFLRYDENWETVKAYTKNPQIHMYNVPQLAFEGQEKNTDGWGTWITEGDPGFETFSAPGYSFARHIQPHIHVPIGIIGCNWGGTTASAWLDEACLNSSPLDIYLKEYLASLDAYTPEELKRISLNSWKFETSEQHSEAFTPLMYGREADWQTQYMKEHANDPVIPMGPWSINRPGGLYHQMLEPLIPFPIKGALWYQGESDACHADIYDKLMTALISCWREKWNDNFPFLFVQLAPFGRWLQCDSTGYCQTRAKQELVSKTLPNTGMVSIMDIGSYYDIHPKQKMEVGRRLALLARGHVYGESILCDSPELSCISIKPALDNTHFIHLTFHNCKALSLTGLSDKPLDNPSPEEALRTAELNYTQLICSEKIKSFRVTQNEKEAFIKNILLEGNQVILQADISPNEPCTVSLAWADYAVINLVNEAGLPVKPFIVTV